MPVGRRFSGEELGAEDGEDVVYCGIDALTDVHHRAGLDDHPGLLPAPSPSSPPIVPPSTRRRRAPQKVRALSHSTVPACGGRCPGPV
ncbi:hypothetical protein GCM10009864_71170 [Streptomyces lunalinharesii]|uniref:Uncharacterized protein n=1 Tax=Streptomyces lunalinharesii TaxID=333384 RepID=A0ABP6F9B2_9ACTN